MSYSVSVVLLENIKIKDRFRKDMGDLESLKEGIKEKGLIQPICVDSNMYLLAGGRRYTACKELEMKEIPVLIRDSISSIDDREVELMENIHRKDMTWQEQSQLIAKIHELYMEKDPKWSQRKTAELIDKSQMTINNGIKLAKAIESVPELATCRTADEALKTVRKEEESKIVAELARRQQERVHKAVERGNFKDGISMTVAKAENDYVITDVFSGLKKVQGRKFQLIECDPPFGLPGIDRQRNFDSTLGRDAGNGDFIDIPEKEYPAFLQRLSIELYGVAADNSWMIFWFAFKWYTEIFESLQSAGWKVNPVPCVWVKGKVPYQPYPDMFLNAYHPFFVCKKGSPFLAHERKSNIFYETGEGEKTYHPHQRPLSLMRNIVTSLIPPTQHVLVPFLGSGVTLRACYLEGYHCIGFDANDKYKANFLLAVEEDTRKFLANDKKSL